MSAASALPQRVRQVGDASKLASMGLPAQTVTIESGMTASLVVPLGGAPEGAPVSGWISVQSPIELQVFEGDRLLGTSRTDRIMVSAGRHEINIVNEALG